MGMGTATVQAQAAAELLALPVENVRFEYGDLEFPSRPSAGGSNQERLDDCRLIAAREVLFEELLKLADGNSRRSPD